MGSGVDVRDNVVCFEARAKLILNGRKKSLTGGGTVDEVAGTVWGKYQHDIPANDTESLIFQTVLVTGYPSICRTTCALQNPFKRGDYKYRRSVDLGAHGKIAYNATCWLESKGGPSLCLQSEFEVEAELMLPGLHGAMPLVEKWSPEGRSIASSFNITWPTISGSEFVRGIARTEYRPAAEAPQLCRPISRHIRFLRAASEKNRLEIVQESWLGSDDD